MSIYHDPESHTGRPTLVGDLLGIPARDKNHQLENQSTAVLAWLIDRSATIAHKVLELFLGPAADIATDHAVGARTQISLPKLAQDGRGGGALYPDLSVCAADHTLQLLVEVKVASIHAVYPEYEGMDQPAVYRHLWAKHAPDDTTIQAVGTLTRHDNLPKTTKVDLDQRVACDVSWRELAGALQGLLTANAVEVSCVLVAQSFVAAIEERIDPAPPSAEELTEFFSLHDPLLDAAKDEVMQRIPRAGAPKTIRGKAYYGWRIPLPSATDAPLFLRMYLAPKGTRLNLAGEPDSLIVAPERGPNGELEDDEKKRVVEAGFADDKDIEGWRLRRRVYPLGGFATSAFADDLVSRLEQTELLPRSAIVPDDMR